MSTYDEWLKRKGGTSSATPTTQNTNNTSNTSNTNNSSQTSATPSDSSSTSVTYTAWKNRKNGVTDSTTTAPTPITQSNTTVEEPVQTTTPSNDFEVGSNYNKPRTGNRSFTTKSGKTVSESQINEWLDPNYEWKDGERKTARELSKNVLTLIQDVPDNQKGSYYEMFSELDMRSKYGQGLMAFTKGILESTPFIKAIGSKAVSGMEERAKDDAYLQQKLEAINRDKEFDANHKFAEGAGNFVGKAAQYSLAKNIPAVGKVADKIGGALGGSRLAQGVGNIAADTLVDLGLDTIPELAVNVSEGKSGGEIAKDAAKNIGTNIAFNVGGEALSMGAEAYKNAKSMVDTLADNVKNYDIPELDTASKIVKNADDVVKNADNVAKSVDDAVKNADVKVDAEPIKEVVNNATDNAKVTNLKEVEAPWDTMNGTAKSKMEKFVEYNGKAVPVYKFGTGGNASNYAIPIGTKPGDVIGIKVNPLSGEIIELKYEGKNKLKSIVSHTITDNLAFEPEPIAKSTVNTATTPEIENLLKEMNGEEVADDIIKRTELPKAEEPAPELPKLEEPKIEEPKVEVPEAVKPIENVSAPDDALTDSIKYLDNQIVNLEDEYAKSFDLNSKTDIEQRVELLKQKREELIGRLENTQTDAIKETTDDVLKEAQNFEAPEKYTQLAANEPITAENPPVEFNGEVGNVEPPKGKVSATRSNTLENSGLNSAEELKSKYLTPENFTYTEEGEAESVGSAIESIAKNPVGRYEELMGRANDNLSNEEIDTLFIYYDTLVRKAREAEGANNTELANEIWEMASATFKKLQKAGTYGGQAVQAFAKWSRNTPEGMLLESTSLARRTADKLHVLEGYSNAVDDMADDLADAIKKGDNAKAEKILKGSLGKYSTSKAGKRRYADKQIDGQLELWEYIKKEQAKGTSSSDLAEEAGRILKKNANVVTLTTKQEKQMIDLFQKASAYDRDSYECRQLIGEAMQILNKEMPSSVANKIKTTLYDNMLGNIKTAITRNFGGNFVGNTIEGMQKPLRVGLDKAVSVATKKRNYVFDKDTPKAYASGFKKGIVEQTKDLKSGIPTTRSGENSMKQALDAVTTAYKGSNKISKALGEYDRLVKGFMAYGDRPFYESAYSSSKNQLEKIVSKYGENALQTVGVPDSALGSVESQIEFLARQRALEACYQNGSLSAEAFGDIKKGFSKLSKEHIGFDLLSQTSMPFTQVPANMFSRMVDYTPLGFVRNGARTVGELSTTGLNQKRFVDSTTRNLVGLGMFGGATAMANNGFITGSYSDDEDKKKAQRDAGELEYALQINGKQYDISDLPVLGPMAKGGAAMSESLKENEDDIIKGIWEGTKTATAAALDNSMMQGVNRLLGTNTYSNEGNIFDNAINTVLSGGSQAIPSIIRQGSQTVDTYKRDLGEYGTLDYYKNNFINSTPARFMLDKKLDREGNEVLNNNGRSIASRAAENFILPYKISEPHYSAVTTEANRLFDEKGSSVGYIPQIKQSEIKKIKGYDESSYSYETYKSANQEFDKRTSADGQVLISSEWYQSLEDEEKLETLSKLYEAEKHISKVELAEKGKSRNELIEMREKDEIVKLSDNKIAQILKNEGIESAIEYMHKKDDFDKADISTQSTVANTLYGLYGTDGLDLINSIKSYSDNNSVSNASTFSYFISNNVSPEQAGEYLYYLNGIETTDSKAPKSAYESGGYVGLYEYYLANYETYLKKQGGSSTSGTSTKKNFNH